MFLINNLIMKKNSLPLGEGLRGAFLLLILIFFSLNVSAEDDITVKRERVFTGTGLYGFMNGGADLYLEYGVKKLTTRDLVYMGESYTLDIYEMPTPEDAYGIYSVHTFRCMQADIDDEINCLSTYQFQTVKANLYVSLVFTSGSTKAKENAKSVIQHYIADIEEEQIPFHEQLQSNFSKPFSGRLKFLRGPISISGAQLSLAKTLEGVKINGVWFFPSDKEGENRAIVLFNDAETTNTIREKIETDNIVDSTDIWLHIRCIDTKKPADDRGPFGF